MITRSHEAEGKHSVAVYSDCETYRYRLTRRWSEGGTLAFIMLNPSTASELRNDPTIARCEARARALHFGAVDIVNLFAFRATQPADLKAAQDPEGPDNKAVLQASAAEADCLVAAWGVHGGFLGQGAIIADLLDDHVMHCLGTTKHGHPRHPLYIRSDAVLVPWVAPR